MKNNSIDDVREILNMPEIPEKLHPDNIAGLLDSGKTKRSKIKKRTWIRAVAGLAACAVLGTFAAYNADWLSPFNKNKVKNSVYFDSKGNPITLVSYMSGANEYEEIYSFFAPKQRRNSVFSNFFDSIFNNDGMKKSSDMFYDDSRYEMLEIAPVEALENFTNYTEDGERKGALGGNDELPQIVNSEEAYKTSATADTDDFSETFNQEKGVLEADIVKTDGRFIYYASSDKIMIAEVDKGNFIDTCLINPDRDLSSVNGLYITDLYLVDDTLIVLAGSYNHGETYVLFYNTGLNPELTASYVQDGYYNNVRIVDGYMYLITNYCSEYRDSIKNEKQLDKYIPQYEVDGEQSFIPADCILLPEKKPKDLYQINYAIIGGISLDGEKVDVKALADYSGQIYCSTSNMYVTSGWDKTAVTRINVSGGHVTPSASGKVNGYVKDQFSMSEYDGYFRIATSVSNNERYNKLFVLDMGMKIVGESEGYGIGEDIKSSQFSGNLAYVVTFRQTDPLYAFDLSDPKNPVILDEYKINGYSSYMQPWGDNLMLGFGVEANDAGLQTGIKIVMFDVSDPNNLKEVGIESITYNGKTDTVNWNYGGNVSSMAVWDRKALIINPEKNLIGFPIENCSYDYRNQNNSWWQKNSYVFYSYENGRFNLLGEISDNTGTARWNRAVYIGDYVYALSDYKFASASLNGFNLIDEIYCHEFKGYSEFYGGNYAERTEAYTEEPVTGYATEDFPKDKIVFVSSYQNWAWGYQHNGTFIDTYGYVYEFDFSGYEPGASKIDYDFVEMIYDVYYNSDPTYIVDNIKTIADSYSLMSEINLDAKMISEPAANDAGQKTLFILDDRKLIELKSTGDCNEELDDGTARKIVSAYEGLTSSVIVHLT